MLKLARFVKKYERFILPLLLIPFYLVLYKIYIPRINAFGCFDDCFNFMGGYFMLSGKHIFSDFFFNHLPFMGNISFLIQRSLSIENIYELVLRHRQFVLLFGFFWNFIIILRFRYVGLFFVFFYELTKFYFFGDRFLGEALIVYPIVYSFGLVIEKFKNQKISRLDLLIAAVSCWFVLFTREPFVPLSLILFLLTLLPLTKNITIKIVTILFFVLLSLFTVFQYDISAFIFNVYTINSQTVFSSDIARTPLPIIILKGFFYPLDIFGEGFWNVVRYWEIFLSLIFVYLGYQTIKLKRVSLGLIVLIILGVSNLRPTLPGRMYYEAFHMLPWYALFLFSIFSVLFLLEKSKQKILIPGLILGLIIFLFVPQSFLIEKPKQQDELITNYGSYMHVGEVIKILSNEKDTLFVDGFDDLIIWQSKRTSPYKYTWYTSLMPLVKVYSKERENMFETNPPDFYYGQCPDEQLEGRLIPSKQRGLYQNLHSLGRPTCLYVKKTKLKEISRQQWELAEKSLYKLP